MRYISPYVSYVIYSNDDTGNVLAGFRNGVYIKGDPAKKTDAVDKIDDTKIMPIFEVDLADATTNKMEMGGMGDLTKITTNGLRGYFFEAPPIAVGATSCVKDLWYEVLTGDVVHAGVTFTPGKRFKASGVATTGTGTIALIYPPSVDHYEEQYLNELFAVQHLEDGKEVRGYFGYTNEGFTPTNSTDNTSPDYFARMD